jgi:hypothetical protein
MYLSSSSNGG